MVFSFRTQLLLMGVLLAGFVPLPAHAEEAQDLEQTIADLGSQANDKERIDRLGAARVEVNEIRTWLKAATNAVKEGAEKAAKRYFELVRAQMKLVDQIVAMSVVEHEAKRLEREITTAKQRISALSSELDEKRVRLRALKLKESSR